MGIYLHIGRLSNSYNDHEIAQIASILTGWPITAQDVALYRFFELRSPSQEEISQDEYDNQWDAIEYKWFEIREKIPAFSIFDSMGVYAPQAEEISERTAITDSSFFVGNIRSDLKALGFDQAGETRDPWYMELLLSDRLGAKKAEALLPFITEVYWG